MSGLEAEDTGAATSPIVMNMFTSLPLFEHLRTAAVPQGSTASGATAHDPSLHPPVHSHATKETPAAAGSADNSKPANHRHSGSPALLLHAKDGLQDKQEGADSSGWGLGSPRQAGQKKVDEMVCPSPSAMSKLVDSICISNEEDEEPEVTPRRLRICCSNGAVVCPLIQPDRHSFRRAKGASANKRCGCV